MAPPTTGGAPGRRGRSAATSTGPCPPRRAGRRRRPERAAGLALGDPRSPRSVHFLQACGRGVNGCTGAFQALGAGSSPVARFARIHSHGEWRSLVAHPAGGRAVAGSNPVSPTQQKARICGPFALWPEASTSNHAGSEPVVSQGRDRVVAAPPPGGAGAPRRAPAEAFSSWAQITVVPPSTTSSWPLT